MKIKLLLSGLALACTLSGCDWVKSTLGMATSEEIRQLKMEQQELERRQRALDSLQRVCADSAAVSAASAARERQTAGPEKRYYVIVGSYLLESNADRMYARVEKQGLTPSRFRMKNGFELIAAGGSDDFGQACALMYTLYGEEPFSTDIWIYDTESYQ